MIDNGYIVLITESGGGQDSDFNPIPVTTVESEKIGCNLKKVKRDYKLFVSGKYVQAKYTVVVDSNKVDVDLSTIKNVELFDKNEVSRGKFLVIDNEPYGLLNSSMLTLSEIT